MIKIKKQKYFSWLNPAAEFLLSWTAFCIGIGASTYNFPMCKILAACLMITGATFVLHSINRLKKQFDDFIGRSNRNER